MKYGVSLVILVLFSIFVFWGSFRVVEVSNVLVVECVYSFLVTFLRPLTFSVSQENGGLLTLWRGRYRSLVTVIFH